MQRSLRLILWIAFLLPVTLILLYPVCGDNPTYSECKPHIEATIRDLAAKAIQAGQVPTQPAVEAQSPEFRRNQDSVAEPPVPHEPVVGSVTPQEPHYPDPVYDTPAVYPPPPVSSSEEAAHHKVPTIPDVKPETQKYEAPVPPRQQPVPATKPKLGIFDKFIDFIFGLPKHGRDPKYAEPWQTHPEFKKKPAAPVIKEPPKPGIFTNGVNKVVDIIFGLPKTGRDPKWATPWQTHQEFRRRAIDTSQAKAYKPTPSIFSSFVNAIVDVIFGLPKAPRDEKWSKPWQSHKEHKKKMISDTPVKVKVEHGNWKFVDSVVDFIFGLPKCPRDPKWAQPWQTHKEHLRRQKSGDIEVKKVETTTTGRGIVDFIVDIIFGLSKQPRDEKWSRPWQTHKEMQKIRREEFQAPATKIRSWPGSSLVNSIVYFIFGMPKASRDSKWAYPWSSHKDPSFRPPLQGDVYTSTDAYAKGAGFRRDTLDAIVEVTISKAEISSEFPASYPDTTYTRKPEGDRPYYASTPETSTKQVLETMEGVPAKDFPKETFKRTVEEEDPMMMAPSMFRSRDHIESILGLDTASQNAAMRTEPIAAATIKELKRIYDSSIKPLETLYKYQDISNRHLTDAELFGTPLMLLLGPYSTGKSSFINYLTGLEFTKKALKTGTPPSHGVFRVVQYGEQDRELDGTDLSAHWSFASLQKFGQRFMDQVYGKSLNIPLLKKVTFVEAPGILEMRRPGERLYPFNDVVQWFIDRADLILIMFDYTKLDAGYEMEAILDQLKGREAQTRILLNKADQVPPEELIKVQGSLFWNLSPLLGVSTPPTVYAGSFASLPYRPSSPMKLFQAQEQALLHDIANAIRSRVDNRIAIARRHAVRVRNHAKMVDSYLTTFYRNKGFLTSKHKLADDIIENPHAYNIYEGISLLTNISRYDLPDPEIYRDFFRVHNLYDFSTLRSTCSYISGCPLDKIDKVISHELPELLARYRRLVDAALPTPASQMGMNKPVPQHHHTSAAAASAQTRST